jgi:Zn-dependent membrane protease YugP
MPQEEIAGARRVLSAAALTYVAAFVSSVLTLLYWLVRLGVIGGGRRD